MNALGVNRYRRAWRTFGASVLIATSGNVAHNLRALDWSQPESGFDWARRFDDDVRAVLADQPAELVRLSKHAHFSVAAPTPDHFLPLGVCWDGTQRLGTSASSSAAAINAKAPEPKNATTPPSLSQTRPKTVLAASAVRPISML